MCYKIINRMSILKTTILICASMLMICLTSCSKEKGKPETESMLEKYAPILKGERIWKVVRYVDIPAMGIDTVYSLQDDTFSLELPTLDTLIFRDFRLSYKSSSFTGEVVDTTKFLYYESYLSPHYNRKLKYYYASDSVVATTSTGGLGGSTHTVYTSKR